MTFYLPTCRLLCTRRGVVVVDGVGRSHIDVMRTHLEGWASLLICIIYLDNLTTDFETGYFFG